MNISRETLRLAVAVAAMALCGKVLADGIVLGNGAPYKQSFEERAVLSLATNIPNWTSTSEDDITMVTNLTYTLAGQPPFDKYPLNETNHTKVLKLNTEGGTLSANFDGNTTDFAGAPVYIDTVVNFVVSEDDPSFAGQTNKIAIFANAESNLVVRHGMYIGTEESNYHVVTNSVIDFKVDPEKWYRLTIVLKQHFAYGNDRSLYKIILNGDINDGVVTNANAYSISGKKEWFFSATIPVQGHYSDLAAVSFQGTGYIDDLVVTREDPFEIPNQGMYYYVYVGITGTGGTVVTNGLPFNSGTEAKLSVDDALTITYTANEWHRLTLVSNNVQVVSGVGSYVQEINGANNEYYTNLVTFAAATQGQVNMTNAVPVAWASTNYATEAAALADAHLTDYYALNVAPSIGYTNISLNIDSIAVAGNNVTVVALLKNGQTPLSTKLNGCLTIYGKTSLDDPQWVAFDVAAIEEKAEFDQNGKKSVVFDGTGYNFYRAIISVETPQVEVGP